jgi:hypothetical protein
LLKFLTVSFHQGMWCQILVVFGCLRRSWARHRRIVVVLGFWCWGLNSEPHPIPRLGRFGFDRLGLGDCFFLVFANNFGFIFPQLQSLFISQ